MPGKETFLHLGQFLLTCVGHRSSMRRILNPLSLIFVDFLFIKFPGSSWGTEIRLGLYLSREQYTTFQPPPHVSSILLLILHRYSQIVFTDFASKSCQLQKDSSLHNLFYILFNDDVNLW